MLPCCVICSEPLTEPTRVKSALCLICVHRTTSAERRDRRPLEAGVLDSA